MNTIREDIFFQKIECFLGTKLLKNIKNIILGKTIIVDAVAGSGKTTLVSIKAAYLILVKGIEPEKILIMTFTNNGVIEIKKKIINLLKTFPSFKDNNHNLPYIITYNSYAQQLILTYDTGRYYLLSPKETLALAMDFLSHYKEKIELLELTSINTAQKLVEFEYSEKQVELNNQLLAFISLIEKPNAFIKKTQVTAIKRLNLLKIAKAFDGFKEKHRLFTFNDQINKAIAFIQEDHIVKHENWKAFIFDEYQDTSILHNKLVYLLTNRQKTPILYVGDEMQAIFQWSNNKLNSLLNVQQLYKEVDFTNHSMELNYRSDKKIIDLINFFLKRYCYSYIKIKKQLVASKDESSNIVFIDYNEQLKCYSNKFFIDNYSCYNHHYCNILYQISKRNLGSVILLFRKNEELKDFYLYLSNSFYFRVKNYCSILMETLPEFLYFKSLLILLFTTKDAFQKNYITCSILQNNPYNLDANQIQEILNHFHLERRYKYFHHFLIENLEKLNITFQVQEKLMQFVKLITTLKNYIGETFESIFFNLIFHSQIDQTLLQQGKTEELSFIYRIIELFKTEKNCDDVYSFLEFIENKDKINSLTVEHKGFRNISLSTVHKAKGGEWTTVCIVNLIEDKFPLKFRRNSFLNNYACYIDDTFKTVKKDHLLDYLTQLDQESFKEDFYYQELKLIYVALTRAKSNLIISGTCDDNNGIFKTLKEKSF